MSCLVIERRLTRFSKQHLHTTLKGQRGLAAMATPSSTSATHHGFVKMRRTLKYRERVTCPCRGCMVAQAAERHNSNILSMISIKRYYLFGRGLMFERQRLVSFPSRSRTTHHFVHASSSARYSRRGKTQNALSYDSAHRYRRKLSSALPRSVLNTQCGGI